MSLQYETILCPCCGHLISQIRCSVTGSTLESCNHCDYYAYSDPAEDEVYHEAQ